MCWWKNRSGCTTSEHPSGRNSGAASTRRWCAVRRRNSWPTRTWCSNGRWVGQRIEDVNGRDMMGLLGEGPRLYTRSGFWSVCTDESNLCAQMSPHPLLGQSRIEMSLCFVIYDDLCVVGTLSYHWHIPYWHKELGKKLSWGNDGKWSLEIVEAPIQLLLQYHSVVLVGSFSRCHDLFSAVKLWLNAVR